MTEKQEKNQEIRIQKIENRSKIMGWVALAGAVVCIIIVIAINWYGYRGFMVNLKKLEWCIANSLPITKIADLKSDPYKILIKDEKQDMWVLQKVMSVDPIFLIRGQEARKYKDCNDRATIIFKKTTKIYCLTR